ncbi:hypothetical protein [Kurthia massiliensis]|uniref:hypothetical protein n=1 Tax=Kurthia massiliensis TaxID=1033739 RepID=UPI0002894380|nr:hypothetical protein [Kurthia massiliensis]
MEPIDFDPFVDLDLDGDGVVEDVELKFHELEAGNGFNLDDLNHNGILDKFENDLNMNGVPDTFEVDFNQNSVLDVEETVIVGTRVDVDLDGDGLVDETDIVMTKYFFTEE